jgi:hypothetical protein
LSPELAISPSKKKARTFQQVMIIESKGGDEEMEMD